MNTKKNHGKTMKFFLWSAFTLNLILIIISIIWHINLIIIAGLLLSLMILIVQKKHGAFVRSNSDGSTHSLFYRYILKLLGNKSGDDTVFKASIHYTPNPDPEKNEGLLHATNPVKLEQVDFNLKVGSIQCTQPAKFSLFNLDIPDITYIDNEVIPSLNLAGNDIDMVYSIHGLEETNFINGNIILKLPVNHATDFLQGNNLKKLLEKTALTKSIRAIEILLNTPLNNCYSVSELMDISNNRYFNNPDQLMDFIIELRKISNGIPIGIRTGISGKEEFTVLCKAFYERGTLIDFINIIGEESEPISYSINQNGKLQASIVSLEHALVFAARTLKKFRLDKEIKICATGNINNGFELLKLISLGANTCMLTKPSGYFNNLVSEYTNENKEIIFRNQIIQLHNQIMEESLKLMEYAGFSSIEEIDSHKFFRKLDQATFKNLRDIYNNQENYYNLGKYEVFNHLN